METNNNINKDIHSKAINNNNKDNINDNFNMNAYIQNNTIECILMEKDKEIINLSSQIKTLNTNIDTLTNSIKNKDLEISLLKADLETFNNEKKIFEEEKEKYQKEICDLQKLIEEKNNKIEEITLNNNISKEKLNDILLSKNNEYNELNNEYYKIHNDLNLLNNKLILKDSIINKLENTIYKSKEKSNKFILLNKEIEEKNELIKNLQIKIANMNNELILSKNLNEDNVKRYNDIEKGERNKIFTFFIGKIQNLIIFLENDKNFDSPDKICEKMVEIKEGFIFYDLLEQNILLLKNKIINKYNGIIMQNNEYKKVINKQKNQIKKLSLDFEQTKKFSINKNYDLIDKLNKNISESYEEVNILSNKKPNTTKEINGHMSENNFNEFYKNALSKVNKAYLKEFNLANYRNIQLLTVDEKSKNIINIIDCLNDKINHLNSFVKEYENYKNKINKIINQNLSRSNGQNNEILELKNTIKDLNELLDQSNIYLKQSRKENDILKRRNLNLEKAINMISENNTMMVSQNNKDNLLKNNILNNYPSFEEINYFN